MSWHAPRPAHSALAFAAILALALMGSGCGLLKDESLPQQPGTSTNVILNPGFEEGSSPWISGSTGAPEPVVVTGGAAYGGDQSLQLALDATGGPGASAGAVQFTTAAEFPEFLSGYYMAEDWPREGARPYLEVTIAPQQTDVYTPAMRFIVAGLQREPAESPDSRTVMVSRRDPDPGKWTFFSYPVKQAYLDRTGELPGSWATIAIALQLRYEAPPEVAPPAARVHFDDLYLGPQAGNPNRPPDSD